VTLSNDSWFDDGAGPEQHFALASLRTAETRRPMVRVTTTGVSALVGEEGLLSWRLPTGTGAIALLDVVPPHYDSVFTRGGGAAIFALIALIATVAVALPSLLTAAAARERSHGANHE
jgi:apolipoprotein N-acyltransferase